jgi:spore coat polysaccharide biosynthesis protein SpsF
MSVIMKIGVIVQARMNSTRLPGKILMDLCGKTVLEQLICRIENSVYKPEIIIASTINPKDDVLENLCFKNNYKLFRGSEEDVLSRYYLCAEKYNFDIIVRVTSDCPLYEYRLLDEMLKFFLASDYDYISNFFQKRTYPRGLDTEIFRFSALNQAFNEAKEPSCREHVTPYIYQSPEKFSAFSFTNEENHSNLRWTLDTIEDYQLIRNIYEYLYPINPDFGYIDIIKAYETHSEWYDINKNVQQKKTGY